MEKTTVSAEQMAGFVLELFKSRPWLNEPGIMQNADAIAEAEAVDFLLALESAKNWGKCSMPARRIVNSLLLDFIGKLMDPLSALSRSSWEVSSHDEPWRKAIYGIAHEIRQSHRRFQSPH